MRTAFEGPELNAPQPAAVSTISAEPFMRAIEVRGSEALAQHLADWDDLCRQSLEPNVFYEPWMLLPAVEAFGEGLDLRFVLIYAEDRAGGAALPVLCGLFPLERRTRYRGLPVESFTLWRHLHCFLCTPPVRAGLERETLAAFFDWLRDAPDGVALMEFGWINTDGPFYELLAGYLEETGRASFVSDHFTRALCRPGADADTYLAQAISKEHRRDYRRRQNRLSEKGRLEYVALEQDADAREWLESFLTLEASGWKGREGSAFASDKAAKTFFIESMTEAFDRGRLMMLAIKLDGRFVALKCNLMAGRGSFAFKIAYDEEYALFCPGVLLELENIRLLHGRAEIEWMDSCAEPNHFMMNRVWTERREIIDLAVSAGTKAGNLAISSFPLLRWISRKLVRPTLSILFAGLEVTG
ncbi:MAG TPA: GNAT family N-acetyltransferase [Blastocatellia bacterium]|nr:GNAT family N-acetyltransferase [Blastocatellia bacterium]